ncbi:MAG: hypothetical protein IH584_02480 [Candidatus Aminicenantes bacterium]|nr:hypothetical protein [Candidatus Aminicenantes bacterium]
MIDLVRTATGTNKPIETEVSRLRPDKSEVRALIADARLFSATTGWAPRTAPAHNTAASRQNRKKPLLRFPECFMPLPPELKKQEPSETDRRIKFPHDGF